jgi:hypothetical protein
VKPLDDMRRRTSKRRNNELCGAIMRISENLFRERDHTTPHTLIEGKLCSIHYSGVRFVAVCDDTIVAEFRMWQPHSIGHPMAEIWVKFLQELLALARIGARQKKRSKEEIAHHRWLFKEVKEALKEAK